MRYIRVGNHRALIDNEDFDKVTQYAWYPLTNRTGDVYAVTSIRKAGVKRRTLSMHRLVMDATHGQEVDHIRHRTLDNRKSQLRICTRMENRINERPRGKYYKGVTFDPKKKLYRARIAFHNRRVGLGRFKDPKVAARAYDLAARIFYGEFAYLNRV